MQLVSKVQNNSHLVLADSDPCCRLILWLTTDTQRWFITFVPVAVLTSVKQSSGMKTGWPLGIRGVNQTQGFGWLFMIFMVFSNWSLFENDVYSKYIRMNTGYWHRTVVGTLQMKTMMCANSGVFLVLKGLCCLALDPCSAIPHCAHSCPTAVLQLCYFLLP